MNNNLSERVNRCPQFHRHHRERGIDLKMRSFALYSMSAKLQHIERRMVIVMAKEKQSDLYIHGYEIDVPGDSKVSNYTKRDLESVDWENEFDMQRENLLRALRIRNQYGILGRSATQCLAEVHKLGPDLPLVKFITVELLQAIFLMNSYTERNVPASPRSLHRLWKSCDCLVEAYVSRIRGNEKDDNDERGYILFRMRLHTLHYRLHFDRDKCLHIMGRIAKKFDKKTRSKYGIGDRYMSVVNRIDECSTRLMEHHKHLIALETATTHDQVTSAAAFIVSRCELARYFWTKVDAKSMSFQKYRRLTIEIVEASHEWIYTFSSDSLSEFDKQTLEWLSLKPGDLAGCQFEHFFLENPTWAKPFVLKPDGNFFTAQPHAAFAFPFKLFETLLPDNDDLSQVLPDCKSEVLEELVFETVSIAMPSARVYKNVQWTDPQNGNIYENDVIVIAGNQIFVFEAKSGKIADQAKRGAIMSLKGSLEKLFVEPAQQSERLQHYLNENSTSFKLSEKGSSRTIDIDLSKPKEVYRFSVIMESVASITASRRFFEGLELIERGTPWAPAFSINEFQMIAEHLDSEVSFGHYLSRRYSIDKLLDFDGDEQDLLSMYLTNGFCILGENTTTDRVLIASDMYAREPKNSRDNRKNSDVVGIRLNHFWKSIVDRVYLGDPAIDQHKFDILFTLLNQPPPGLAHLHKRISKWKSGGGGISKSGQHTKYVIGERQYIVMINFVYPKHFIGPEQVIDLCRSLAHSASENFFGTSDCVVLTYMKGSKALTFDVISFFRALRSNRPDGGPLF